MAGIRNDIANALDRKQVPPFTAGSMRDLGRKLGLASPMSLRTLDDTLKGLPPASVVFSSGSVEANFVHGWSQLGIQSDGLFSFRGHVHESGVAGDNYFFMVALLDVKNSAGNTLVFPQDDWVAGQLDFGPSDRDFQNDGFNQLLVDQWDTARNSQVQFRLHVSSNPLQVTETFALGLIVAAGVIFGGYGASRCNWHAGTGEQQGTFTCFPGEEDP